MLLTLTGYNNTGLELKSRLYHGQYYEVVNLEANGRKRPQRFFGEKIDTVTLGDISNGILEKEKPDLDDAESYDFLSYLYLAMTLQEKEESAVDDFAAELLKIMSYGTQGRIVRVRKTIKFFMCGEDTQAETDVCIMDPSQLFFLLQEDKSHISSANPEA
ncbi:hypothetical protein CONCODRAFT_9023 [Conidiobolus coronatus NRRL 28638]|uniref:Uncharacterized protein n=1 Tax=Conidiobolus coronatus (strain ATCC 28846 / CBS 209.66 / NRRL 28638) TaxID=796925 RepID=A0A137P115_CONC2|nr:hypothetical protein CONCODRAFT_9023 [Conidiobolus coronatus NRRL 28638]|eukprot:KXN68692.1 hypothetical protein CONCODRAFT_9023 [Conidiobolus coronatus NRRL 28638]